MTITHESHVTITADGLQTWVHWTWPHFRWSKSTNFGLTHLSYFILYPMIQWKISSPNKQKAILHTSPHWTWLKHSNSLNSLNLKIAETCGHTNPIPIIPVMSQVMMKFIQIDVRHFSQSCPAHQWRFQKNGGIVRATIANLLELAQVK